MTILLPFRVSSAACARILSEDELVRGIIRPLSGKKPHSVYPFGSCAFLLFTPSFSTGQGTSLRLAKLQICRIRLFVGRGTYKAWKMTLGIISMQIDVTPKDRREIPRSLPFGTLDPFTRSLALVPTHTRTQSTVFHGSYFLSAALYTFRFATAIPWPMAMFARCVARSLTYS